ncbi:MAG: hypothetical protein JO142_08850 [Burkholderiales bacterium]|nr:hypothetical protein [Burkholderiales bacterium]
MNMRYGFLGIALLALTGCATNPVGTSLIDGSRKYDRADFHLYQVRVLAIDGDYSVDRNPVRAAPGEHELLVATAPVAGFHDEPTKKVKFKVEPCKWYYIAARREERLSQDFELVTQEVEPLAGCTMPQ